MPRAVTLGDEIRDAIRACGYKLVVLDLAGFRSGSLNEGIIPTVNLYDPGNP